MGQSFMEAISEYRDYKLQGDKGKTLKRLLMADFQQTSPNGNFGTWPTLVNRPRWTIVSA